MNIFLILALAAAAALIKASPAFACFTIVAGKRASATGRVLVGHNEDDGERSVFRCYYVPPAKWPEGSLMPAEQEPSGGVFFRQNVPQARETLGYFWIEALGVSKDAYVGMSGSDMFVNDSGVCVVSNYGGKHSENIAEGGSGIIYLLRRAVAERAKTPFDGVMTAARLVRDYGYIQARVYAITNPDEAWIFQAAGGNMFAAKKLGDDEVVCVANCLTIRGIDFSGAEEIEAGIMSNGTWLWSKGLVENAAADGRYVPSDPNDTLNKDFDFACCYQSHGEKTDRSCWNESFNTVRLRHAISMVTGEEWRGDYGDVKPGHPEQGIPFSVRPKEKLTVEMVKSVLRSHYEGTPDDPAGLREACCGGNPHEAAMIRRICAQTTDTSMIYEHRARAELSAMWLSFGRPCELPYFALHPVCAKTLPAKLRTEKDPAAAMAEHFDKKPDAGTWNAASAWWNMRDLENRLELIYSGEYEKYSTWMREKEAELAEDEREAAARADGSGAEETRAALAAWDEKQFDSLYGELVSRRDAMPSAEIKQITPCLSKSGAPEQFILKFRLGGGREADVHSLRFGAGMTDSLALSYSDPIPWQTPNYTERVGEWWVLAFPARYLAAANSAVLPGTVEYYLCGKDTDGRPFCAVTPVSVTA